jgi:hypothetical protein
MAITAYPLTWPSGWKRTDRNYRMNGQFSKKATTYRGSMSPLVERKWLTVNDGTTRILESLTKMGVSDQDVIISTNVPVRLDGRPRAGEKEPADPGAVAYWQKDGRGQTRCMAIDRYTTVGDNLAAIAATLEAMRAIERHGGAEILDRAFTGFQALNAENEGESWWSILECRATSSRAEIEHAYKTKLRNCHPDVGGSHEAMTKLNIARDQALSQFK